MNSKDTLHKVIKWTNYYVLVPSSCCQTDSTDDTKIPLVPSGENSVSGTAFLFHFQISKKYI